LLGADARRFSSYSVVLYQLAAQCRMVEHPGASLLVRLQLLQACSGASVGVVVVGASMVENGMDATARSYMPASEGEGLDRLDLDLPGRQVATAYAAATDDDDVEITGIACLFRSPSMAMSPDNVFCSTA
jgi:hypothetical protein